MNMEQFYQNSLIGSMVLLGVLILIAVLRSALGPKITDRIIAVNMIGTMTMAIIAVLAVVLNEDYLGDVCIVYAMISFVAVVLLTKVYTGIYLEKKHIHGEQEAIEDNLEHQEEGSNTDDNV